MIWRIYVAYGVFAQIFCTADLMNFSVKVCRQMCDYLNIYCFKVAPPPPVSSQTVGGVTAGGRSVPPCNGSIARSAVDALLHRDRVTAAASATDSSHSRSSSASSSCDATVATDSHHVTTRSQVAQTRALRQTHPQ